jgi:hypothetical protein
MKKINTSAGKLPVISETDLEPVTLDESKRLIELEKVIEAGQQTFIEVGTALAEIRDARLYKADYKTFENYCVSKWGFRRAHAYRIIEAAGIAKYFSPNGGKSSGGKMSPNGDTPDTRRAARAAELDAQINQSIADINTTAADFADEKLPAGFIDFNGMKELFKTRGQSFGVKLTDADETGFRVIEWYLANGAEISRETVLKMLAAFNPAREMELAA